MNHTSVLDGFEREEMCRHSHCEIQDFETTGGTWVMSSDPSWHTTSAYIETVLFNGSSDVELAVEKKRRKWSEDWLNEFTSATKEVEGEQLVYSGHLRSSDTATACSTVALVKTP